MRPLIRILYHYDEQPYLVSNFNVVESVLCKVDADFIETGDLACVLTEYLDWILTESEVCQAPASSTRSLSGKYNLRARGIFPGKRQVIVRSLCRH
jgi:hypothetical protein